MEFGIPKPIAGRNLIVVAVGFVQIQQPLSQNPQWKRSINPNRLIHIHLWPRRHVADPALAESVLKDILLGCARKFHTRVFICPKGKFKGVNQTINILMRNLGLFEVKRSSTKKPEGTQPNLTDSIQVPSGSVISKIGYSSNNFSVFRPLAVTISTRYKPRANGQCIETVPEVTAGTKKALSPKSERTLIILNRLKEKNCLF